MRFALPFVTILFAAAAASAQQTPGDMVGLYSLLTPHFFISLLTGVLLAFGFQLMLTIFSLALGLSFTPDIRKVAARRRVAALDANGSPIFDEDDADEETQADHHIGLKITSGIGLWAVISSCLALFFASWLAVQFSMSAPAGFGLILGLVIWACFFIGMTYFDLKVASSVLGGLIHTGLAGIRGSVDGFSRLFSRSEEKQAARNARHTVRAIYGELGKQMHKSNLDRKLERYVRRLEPKEPDYKRIAKELSALLEQIQLEEHFEIEEGELYRVLDLQLEKHRRVMNSENADKLKGAVSEAMQRSKQHNSSSGKAVAAAESMAPMKTEDAKRLRKKIGEALSRTGNEQVSPEALRGDLEAIISDPKATPQIVRQRLQYLDRGTIASLIAEHPEMDRGKAEKIVSTAEKALDSIRQRSSSSQQQPAAMQDNRSMSEKLEQRIAAYFDGLGHPALDYDAIHSDFQHIMESPSDAPQVVRERLSQLDRDAVVAMLRSNPRIGDEQAEQIADYMMAARDKASDTLDQLQNAVHERYEKARRRSVIIAEKTRQNAVAASWWATLSAVLSAGAAAAGGYLAAQ